VAPLDSVASEVEEDGKIPGVGRPVAELVRTEQDRQERERGVEEIMFVDSLVVRNALLVVEFVGEEPEQDSMVAGQMLAGVHDIVVGAAVVVADVVVDEDYNLGLEEEIDSSYSYVDESKECFVRPDSVGSDKSIPVERTAADEDIQLFAKQGNNDDVPLVRILFFLCCCAHWNPIEWNYCWYSD
jgi:hypothetical protein